MNFLISTLVLLELTLGVSLVMTSISIKSALAAPHTDGPDPKKAEDPDQIASPEKLENVTLTPAPPPRSVGAFVARFNRDDFLYSYKQELILHFGVVFGFKDSSNAKEIINPIAGFDYILPRPFSPKFEMGADISPLANRGHLWFMQRHIANEKGSFRPYYSYGLMNNVNPDEQFASFSNGQNYLARVAVGFENIVRPPKSAVVELVLAVGAQDMFALFTYGTSWGF